ncbi:leukemia-associated protein 7 [Phasianus colchicus]|uniref:Deleted in lymphocytic leukemia 7 n=1 Tax=Phasianus colchicus TaxID=9054 RepID=A0A669R473_PHACC|nr:leukemia-associated protein 7 [Phasianus colchicus]
MAGPAALLESLGHQAEALRTLRAVWGGKEDGAATHPPCIPPQLSQAQSDGAGQHGPAWPSPGGRTEVAGLGWVLELEKERKGPGKSPEEEEGGSPTAVSLGEPRPQQQLQLRLKRPETLREKALCSKLSRVVDATIRLVTAEQTFLLPLVQQHPFPLHPKDSIEFRNICSHMALQREGQQFEKDLHEAHQCLKMIIEKHIYSLAAFPSESYIPVRSALRQILQNLLAM